MLSAHNFTYTHQIQTLLASAYVSILMSLDDTTASACSVLIFNPADNFPAGKSSCMLCDQDAWTAPGATSPTDCVCRQGFQGDGLECFCSSGMKTPDKGDMQGGGMRLTAFAAEDRFRARPRLSQRPRLDLSIIEGLE